jgi:hypothetical protein
MKKSDDGRPSGTPDCGPNGELDCPVPRLTLLFFGAAKESPPGQPAYIPGLQAKDQTEPYFRRRHGP